MNEIRKEFEDYLKTLVESYPKATTTVLRNPSSLSDVGAKSRDLNSKAQAKIQELAKKNPTINALNIKVDLTPLVFRYHGKLMSGHL